MNIQAQIAALEATRRQKMAELNAILEKSGTESRSMDADEAESFDECEATIAQLDKDIARCKRAEELMLKTAQSAGTVAAAVQRSVEDGGVARASGAPAIIHRERTEDFKGQNYTRLCIAQAAVHIKNHAFSAAAYAERRWGKRGAAGVIEILKVGVPSGGTGDDQWAHELLDIDSRYRGDFIEFLYSQTVYDRLPLRQVPANITIKGQDGAGTGYWVGEKLAIPATALDFFDVTLRPLKVAALAALSNEIILSSDPSSEMLVRDGLVKASAQRVDTTFLSTSVAVSNVSPAGMLQGVSPLTAGGEDSESLRNDIGRLYAPFLAAKNASGLHFVMNNGLAKSISLMRNALDQTSFPGLGQGGGTLEGDPVTTGENVGAAHLILLKPSDIYRIGDTGFEVSVSKEATIEMDTAPTGDGHTPASASANMVSMFQNEMTAFKVVRHINFAKRRAGAVQYVGDATYNGQQT